MLLVKGCCRFGTVYGRAIVSSTHPSDARLLQQTARSPCVVICGDRPAVLWIDSSRSAGRPAGHMDQEERKGRVGRRTFNSETDRQYSGERRTDGRSGSRRADDDVELAWMRSELLMLTGDSDETGRGWGGVRRLLCVIGLTVVVIECSDSETDIHCECEVRYIHTSSELPRLRLSTQTNCLTDAERSLCLTDISKLRPYGTRMLFCRTLTSLYGGNKLKFTKVRTECVSDS